MVKNRFLYHFWAILVIFIYLFFAVSSTGTTGGGSHATTMDVFNSATAASTPFLEAGTASLKEKNDQFLRQVSMNLRNESSNYIRSLYYRDDYRNFTNEWYALRDRLYYQALQQNTSIYVKKNLPNIFMDNDMNVVNTIGDIAHRKWIEAGSPDKSPSTPYKSLPGL